MTHLPHPDHDDVTGTLAAFLIGATLWAAGGMALGYQLGLFR